jgi:hypothetical protein
VKNVVEPSGLNILSHISNVSHVVIFSYLGDRTMVTAKELDDYAKYQREQWSKNLKCYSLWDWLNHSKKG